MSSQSRQDDQSKIPENVKETLLLFEEKEKNNESKQPLEGFAALMENVTPLMVAALDVKQIDQLARLLALGENGDKNHLFQRDARGRTALDWARLGNNQIGIAMLRKAMMTDISNSRLDLGNSLQVSSEELVSRNAAQAIDLLTYLKAGDEPRAFAVVQHNKLYREEIELLNQVFFVDTEDEYGFTAIMLAAGQNMNEVVNILLDNDARIEKKNKYGHTAFTWACASGHEQTVRTLLFRGSDIHQTTNDGRTGLHFACLYMKPNVVLAIFHFLFEKFAMFRVQHPKLKFDPQRWSNYANLLEQFMNMKDKKGKIAYDLIADSNKEPDFYRRTQAIGIHIEDSHERFETFSGSHVEMAKAKGKSKTLFTMSLPTDDGNYNSHIGLSSRNSAYSSNANDDDESESGNLEFSKVNSYLPKGSPQKSVQKDNMNETFNNSREGTPFSRSRKDKGLKEFPDLEEARDLWELGHSDHKSVLPDDYNSIQSMDSALTVGKFSHDTDNQHTQGVAVHALGLGHSQRFDQLPFAVGEEEEKVKELFKMIQNRLFEWATCADREAEIAKHVPCWLNCGFVARMEHILPHVRDDCPHRAVECHDCRRSFRFTEIKHHTKFECLKRKVACPHAWAGCCEILCYDAVQTHALLRCKGRPILCRLNCDRYLPLLKREDHEQNHCKKRLMECDVCKGKIIAETVSDHLHNHCPERWILCTVTCGKWFKCNKLQEHIANECILPCKWKCGELIGPWEKRKLHEAHICPARRYYCKYKCNMGGLEGHQIAEHENYQCTEIQIKCPRGCGKKLYRGELESHQNTWTGDCPERLVRCPHNLIGWKIKSVDDQKFGIVLSYRRDYYEGGPKNRYSPDGLDQWLIKFENKEIWVDITTFKFILIDKAKGLLDRHTHINEKFDCGWIVATNLNAHLNAQCKYRKVWLAGTNDKLTLVEKNPIVWGHEPDKYIGQGVPFNQVLAGAMSRDSLDQFVGAKQTHVSCPYCAELTKPEDMKRHQSQVCLMIVVRCTRGCGFKLQRHALQNHVHNECPKRPMQCTLSCEDDTLWVEDMEEHVKNKCPNRLQTCHLKGDYDTEICNEQIRARDMEKHILFKCLYRICRCTCGKQMPYATYATHILGNCAAIPVLCSQGCGEKAIAVNMEHHMQFTCKNRALFYQRYVNCPIGCGKNMVLQEVLEHVCYSCKRRLSDCPLGCGDTIQFDKMRAHLYFCPKRKICCEPEMWPCQKLMYQWFYSEPFSEKDDDDATLPSVQDNEIVTVDNYDEEKVEAGGLLLMKADNDDDDLIPPLDKHYKDVDDESFGKRSTTSRSSIFVEPTGKVTYRSDLRLAQCRHSNTILMTAVRTNEYLLADYIIRQTLGRDLDLENIYGDTALTLACRFGRNDMVELLLQNGANINKETKLGRTALIEVCRASQENKSLIEILIGSGAIVRYKSKKHGKSAMQWARLKKYGETCRLLDLAGVVQEQTKIIFRAIANGENDYVKELLADGDFFHPNNEDRSYQEMEKYFASYREETKNVKDLKGQMKKYTDQVEEAREKLIEDERLMNEADEVRQKVLLEQQDLDVNISKGFTLYEQCAMKLITIDLLEITRMQKPDRPMRIAMFAYAILFRVLDFNKWDRNAYDFPDVKDWWVDVCSSFKDVQIAILKIQSYGLDKLMPQASALMLARAKAMYFDLCKELGIKMLTLEEKAKEMLKFDPKLPSEIESDPRSPKKGSPSKKKRSNSNKKKSGIKDDVDDEDEKNNSDDDYVIPDVDWDSEADDAGGGSWVKGEWVPITRKRKDWWVRPKKNDKAVGEVKLPDPEADLDILNLMNTHGALKFPKSVILAKELGNMEKEEKMRNEILALEYKPNPDLVIIPKFEKEVIVEDDLKIAREHSNFVYCMYVLLKAANQLADNRELITMTQSKVSKAAAWYDDYKEAYKVAVYYISRQEKERSRVEGILIEKMKLARFNLKKSQMFREKVRIARLMNHVSATGHTAISYAASIGNYDAVEELLSRGGTIGATAPLINACATFIQTIAKISILSKSRKFEMEMEASSPKKKGRDKDKEGDDSSVASVSSDVLVVGPIKQKASSNIILEQIFELREKKNRLLKQIVFQRARHRFPVPEAAYTAKWEIIKRIAERRLLHYGFMGSFVFPLAPPPFMPPNGDHHHHRSKRISLMEIVAQGMNDMAAGIYVPVQGWVGPNDPKEPYGQMFKEIKEMWDRIEEKRLLYISERKKLRVLRREKLKQDSGEVLFTQAIRERDFKRCIYLAASCGVSIDFENEDGYTALLLAAEENMNIANHVQMVNEDGQPCMEVEYLLDRTVYRPGIDVEVRSGDNPLIRACSKSRYHIVEALMDRGANINHVNKIGRTPLHYACEVGNSECVRLLIERGCEIHRVDQDGKTPYNLAEDMGFMHIIKMVSQYSTGYFGPLRLTRGRVDDLLSCPNGCSKRLYRYEIPEHLAECTLRDVPCPYNCGNHKLMFKELAEHVAVYCTRRPILCNDCDESYPLADEMHHKLTSCTNRLIVCIHGCGTTIPWSDQERHFKVCLFRFQECSLGCGDMVRLCDNFTHTRRECPNRRISCPLKCTALVVAKNVMAHLKDTCPCRPSYCQFCELECIFKELDYHEKRCKIRKEPCHAHCSESICILDMDEHMRTVCGNRFIECIGKCNLKIRQCDQEAHLEKYCAERQVFCPYKCVVDDSVPVSMQVMKSFPARILEVHTKYECPEKPVQCSLCFTNLVMKELSAHQRDLCQMRLANCSNKGCLKSMPIQDKEDHERHTCRFRNVSCQQGCGQMVLFLYAGKHQINLCPMRFVTCPLQCGEKCRQKDLEEHVKKGCPRRIKEKEEINLDVSMSRVSTSPSRGGSRPGTKGDVGSRGGLATPDTTGRSRPGTNGEKIGAAKVSKCVNAEVKSRADEDDEGE